MNENHILIVAIVKIKGVCKIKHHVINSNIIPNKIFKLKVMIFKKIKPWTEILLKNGIRIQNFNDIRGKRSWVEACDFESSLNGLYFKRFIKN